MDHGELLLRRLRINTRVRFGVAVFLVAGSWGAAALEVIPAGAALPLGLLGVAVATYAVLLREVGDHARTLAPEAATDTLRTVVVVAVFLDLLVLSAAIALLGGVRSPYMAFYLIHITLSCIVLSARSAVAVIAGAFLLVAVQVLLEWSGRPPALLLSLPASRPLGTIPALEVLAVYGTVFAGVGFLVIPVVEWLRRTMEALETRNRHLDRLSRLRRDFLHVAVHNLRSPVGASLLHVQNLRSGMAGPVSAGQEEWLERIEHRLEGMLQLLQDMQTLGELETGDLAERSEVGEVNEIVGDLVADYRAEAAARGMRLEWEPGEGLPPVRMVPRLIREAVGNYISNAFKFAAQGEALVIRTRLARDEGSDWVRVEVEDRGPGIPPERFERLFREFTRLPGEPGQSRPPGSGLGLSIARRIAEVHGGRVGVESEATRGSVFYLLLPPDADGGPLTPARGDSAPGAPEALRPAPAFEALR